MAGHLAWLWARHGQQWPAMAGHGWSCPYNGQSMVSQGPSAQAHGNVWHCVPVFGPESCTLHQAAIPTQVVKKKTSAIAIPKGLQTQDSCTKDSKIPEKNFQTLQLRIQKSPNQKSQTQDPKPKAPKRIQQILHTRPPEKSSKLKNCESKGTQTKDSKPKILNQRF